MSGCVYKLPDGRCDKPGKYMAFCIGEVCSSATPSNYDQVMSYTPEELAKFVADDICELVCGSPSICDWKCEAKLLSWLKSPANKEGDG